MATLLTSISSEDSPTSGSQNILSWARSDIEQKLGFRGARFTRVNNALSFSIGVLLTVLFYAALVPFEETTYFAAMFTQRGPVPYFICLLSLWATAILLIKWRKMALQRKALQLAILPEERDFVLSAASAEQVMNRMYEVVDDPKRFVVFNRIAIALSNLRNLGRVSDVDDILRSQADHDESSMETSYSLLRGFIWAIPVLGFIGTVLGLSEAIGGFGGVLGTSDQIGEIAQSLRVVTGGLATAFETTLEALVAALVIQFLFTFLKKSEEEFMDECSEYCHRNVVNRLRLMPFEQEAE